MARFTLQDGARGLDMQDGTHYNADRSGHVEVTDPAHAAAIQRSEHARRQWLGGTPFTYAGGQSKHCPRCAFTGFLWQQDCPRCHIPLQEQP